MGCDIHMYQEKRVNGKWAAADEWKVDERYPEDGIAVHPSPIMAKYLEQ